MNSPTYECKILDIQSNTPLSRGSDFLDPLGALKRAATDASPCSVGSTASAGRCLDGSLDQLRHGFWLRHK